MLFFGFFCRFWPQKLQKAPIPGRSTQDHRLAALNDAAVRGIGVDALKNPYYFT
jgi:hypothetical protein